MISIYQVSKMTEINHYFPRILELNVGDGNPTIILGINMNIKLDIYPLVYSLVRAFETLHLIISSKRILQYKERLFTLLFNILPSLIFIFIPIITVGLPSLTFNSNILGKY